MARCKHQAQKLPKKSPCAHHCTILLGYIIATKAFVDNWKKNLLNSNISSTCPRNMVNFGPLTAEIGWRVWGTRANFNRFRVLALLLHQWRSTKLCTMFGRVLGWCTIFYIHLWGLLPGNGIMSGAKFTLHPSLAFSYIGSITAYHSSSGR